MAEEVKRTKIPGPPGTGKTYRLLEGPNSYLRQELRKGTHPSKIAYLTFGKDPTEEVQRKLTDIVKEFPKYKLDKDFTFFSTMHAMGKRNNEKFLPDGSNLLTGKAWNGFKDYICKSQGNNYFSKFPYDEKENEDGIMTFGNQYLKAVNLSRCKKIPLKEQHKEMLIDNPNFKYSKLEVFNNHLIKYKDNKKMLDFTDMIDLFKKDETMNNLNLEVVFLDEAQDLSPLQWDMFFYIEEKCKRSYIAGDDDQTIFKFQGADPTPFIELKGFVDDKETTISRRVPKKVFDQAKRILNCIKKRMPKKWEPKGEEGDFITNQLFHNLDYSEGQWFLLFRWKKNNLMVKQVKKYFYRNHIYFDKGNDLLPPKLVRALTVWKKLNNKEAIRGEEIIDIWDYISGKKIKPKGENLKKLKKAKNEQLTLEDLMSEYGLLCKGKWQECFDLIKDLGQISYIQNVEKDLNPKEKARVRIRTIHGAKGDEAENVVIFPDMPRPAWRSAKRDSDTEHRMWFVAVTRAKQKVYWLNAETKNFYRIGNKRIA